MIRVALAGARYNARRLALVAAAIAIGVTFMAGTLFLVDTVRATAAGPSAADRPPSLSDVVLGDGPVPEGVVRTVGAVPGVARAEGVVSGYAQMVQAGRLVGSSESVAVSVAATPGLRAGHLLLGHQPETGRQMVVGADTFAAEHWRIGQRVAVASSQRTQPFRIVGVVGGVAVPGSPTATVTGFQLATAQRLTGLDGEVSEVLVSAVRHLAPRALAGRLRRALGPSSRVLTASAYSALVSTQTARRLTSFSVTLTVLVGISLLVGAFVIFNAFSLVVAQRSRELALLRCLGASGTQVSLVVMAEAALLGLGASVAGVALGLVSARVLRALVEAAGTQLPAGPLAFRWPAALLCVAAGTGVAIAASAVPARHAARVPALVALRQDPVAEGARTHPVGHRLAGAVALCGFGLLVGGLLGTLPAAVVAGGLLVLVGVGGLGRSVVVGSTGALAWPVARCCGFAGALARQNATRHPRRTAASAAAVVVGVAVICALAVIASSARASANDQLHRAVLADEVLTRAGSGPAGNGPGAVPPMPSGVVGALRAQRALATVSPTSYLTFKVGHQAGWGAAIDVTTYPRVVSLGVMQGSLGGLRDGGVAVEGALAEAHGWRVGQVLPFVFAGSDGRGARVSRRRISAIFDSEGYYGGFLFSTSTLSALYPHLQPSLVFVDGRPGAGASVTRAAVAQALSDYPQVTVADPAQVEAGQDRAIDGQVGLVALLSLLALVIGYLGIMNNLALAVVERVREIGLLRAIGLSPRQLGAAVRYESGIIAALGAVVGAAVGLLVAWSLQRALVSDGLTRLSVPWTTILVYLVLSVGAGVAAGALPARRAGRVPLLEALAPE